MKTLSVFTSALRLLFPAVLATALNVHAEPAILDYGNYSTDTVSGLDWLDVDQTWGVTDANLRMRLAPGGDLHAQGWTWATQAEVATLWSHAGITTLESFEATQYVAINDLVNKLRGCMVFGVDPEAPNAWYSGNPLQALTVDGFSEDTYGFGPAMNIDPVGLKAYANTEHYQPRNIGEAPYWGYWLKRPTVGAPPLYTVTASAGANGTISPSAPKTSYPAHCVNFAYTITPNAGYKVADVTVDGLSKGAVTTFTLSDVSGNHQINATFAPLIATLTHHYPFDIDGRDLVGGADLTLQNDAEIATGPGDAKHGAGGLNLNGSRKASTSAPITFGSVFSISLFARLDYANTFQTFLATAPGGTGSPGFKFFSYRSSPLSLGWEDTQNSESAANVLATGNYQHIAAVVDKAAGQVTFYVNGTVVGTFSTATDFEDNLPMTVGAFGGTGGFDGLEGRVDDLKIFSGKLTPDEIVALAGPPVVPEIVVSVDGEGLADGETVNNFGAASVGSDGVSATFTIANVGSGNLAGISFSIDGANPGDFTVTSAPSASLFPNATTQLAVKFSPTATGSRTAVLHILSNDSDESPFDIDLSGNGNPTGEIAVEQPAGNNLQDGAATAAFGTVRAGGGTNLIFTIKNSGPGSLTITSLSIDGQNAGDFTVISNPVSPVASLTGSTTFTVRYAPASGGAKTAVLHITCNDADESPFDITLTGTAFSEGSLFVAANAPATLRNNLTALVGNTFTVGATPVVVTALGFEDAGLNGLVTSHRIGLWNLASTLLVEATVPAGTAGTLIGNYRTVPLAQPLTLAPNTSYRIGAMVTAGGDAWTDKLLAPADYSLAYGFTAGSPANVQNLGFAFPITPQTGLAFRWAPATLIFRTQPEIAIQQPAAMELVTGTSKVDFGSLNLGAGGLAKTFTILNKGNAPLTGLSVTQDEERLKGPSILSEFAIGALGTNTLAPGSSTTFTVTFTPSTTGSRTNIIHVLSNDGDENPFNVTVTGTGLLVAPTVSAQSLSLIDGAFQITFPNVNDYDCGVFASSDPGAPFANWTFVGNAVPAGNGTYRFTDPYAADSPQRFYQLRFTYRGGLSIR